MGALVNGIWQVGGLPSSKDGKFQRSVTQFRHWITADGAAGSSGDPGFQATPDRYHLYVSYACPWAHRTLLLRELKQLRTLISVSVVHPHMFDEGWTFATDFAKTTGDSLFACKYLHQIYVKALSNYSGRVTVPVLWDKQRQTIVSNESGDIMRMFNQAFNVLTGDDTDYYPAPLQADIDTLNATIYHGVNNAVYQVGFAATQAAYDEAVETLFATLDQLELSLQQGGPYLLGAQVTEADLRLFVTLIRFDLVYVGHFKCNLRRILDYPALSAYVRRLLQHPGVASTVHPEHIKHHYYVSHKHLNPSQIVPRGPAVAY